VLPKIAPLIVLIVASLPGIGGAVQHGAPALAATRIDGGVLIFGGTRHTGLEVARLLRARGETVTVFVRPGSDRSELEPLDIRFVVGDAVNADDVNAAFASARYSSVVTTLGCFKCELPPDYLGNRNVFAAARGAGVERVIMISSIGAGDSADAPPWIAKWFLKDVMALKTRAEDYLQGTGIPYTIIRPGGLKDGEPTGNGLLTEDAMAMGIVTRRDLAQLVVAALDDPAAGNKIYSALDTELSWPWGMWD
jgi:nucleoside-diphosphate-sugar epimerase